MRRFTPLDKMLRKRFMTVLGMMLVGLGCVVAGFSINSSRATTTAAVQAMGSPSVG